MSENGTTDITLGNLMCQIFQNTGEIRAGLHRGIDDRMYAKEFEDNYDQVLCYGISFFRKRCYVKKK